MNTFIPPVLFGLVLLLFFVSTGKVFKHAATDISHKTNRTTYSVPSATPIVSPRTSKPLVTFTLPQQTSTPKLQAFLSITPYPTKKVRNITPSITQMPKKPIRTQVKLMPLGDSITSGEMAIGGYRIDLWKNLVQVQGAKIDFVGSLSSGPFELGDRDHEGHSGWTIPQLSIYAFNWMRLYQPDIVLLHIGINDLGDGVPAAVMTENLSKLIGNLYAGKPDTYIVVATLIPTTRGDHERWTSYNASIPGIVASYRSQGRKITSVDMSQALTMNDLVDGIHPNSMGYGRMSIVWYPVVSAIYKEYMQP